MSGGITKRNQLDKPRCIICGTGVEVEFHHAGGRNHVAYFTAPLCKKHHRLVTEAIRVAGVDMRFTSDTRERFSRARGAIYVLLWFLDKSLEDYERKEKQQ